MAKICSNCEKENPSAANFCMFCNTQLVEEDQLSEEDKLRKKNAELQEQVELLKRTKELEKKVENAAPRQEAFSPQIIVPKIVEQKPSRFHYETNETKKQEQPRMFANAFGFEGRIRRTEYFLSCVLCFFGGMLSAIPILIWLLIPLLWFAFAQGAKRCHDLNNSGWYQIIPFYALLLLFSEGDRGVNNYGVSPK